MSLSNSLTTEFIETVINDSAVTVIQSKQDAKSPKKPYVAFRYISNNGIGLPVESHEDTTSELIETNARLRTPQLEVQFFTQTEQQAIKDEIQDYKTAQEYCQEFEDNLTSSRIIRFMRANDFSVLDKNTISDLDVQLQDRWERRSMCELTLNHVTATTDSVEFFNPDQFNVNLTVEGL